MQGLAPPEPRKAPPLCLDDSGGLSPGQSGAQTTASAFDAERFTLAGGRLNGDILHPSVIPFEQLYRSLPEAGMFNPLVSPERPFVFELGAFSVPDRMSLFIFDLRPDIYRFSGVDAGDFVPIEARRFGSIMGFDLTVDQRRQGNTMFEIDPVPIQNGSSLAFTSQNRAHPTFNTAQFAQGKSNQFAASAGAGSALLPQRPTRFGALSIPFTIFAKSKQTVQIRCVIFRPIPTPIAFVEYDMAGVLVPESWGLNMIESVTPPTRGKGGIR